MNMVTMEFEQGALLSAYWVEEIRSPQATLLFELPDDMSVSAVAELIEGARRVEWLDSSDTRISAAYQGIKQITRGQGRMIVILDKEATA